MRVLLCGAAGFTGRAILRELLDADHEVKRRCPLAPALAPDPTPTPHCLPGAGVGPAAGVVGGRHRRPGA